MHEFLIRVGDSVSITIPKENRDWGYNPCPDGTVATVLGFSEIYYGRVENFGMKPGVYVNPEKVKLRLDGQEDPLFECISRLELFDQEEYKRRSTWLLRQKQEDPEGWRKKIHEGQFLRELPETPFWEGDFVRVEGRDWGEDFRCPPSVDSSIFQVVKVDYRYLSSPKWQSLAYQISSGFDAGWDMNSAEGRLTLVERGPVWKYFHGEPVQFSILEEEAKFFAMLGHAEEVRNPASGLYSWTLQEALGAIRDGIADGIVAFRFSSSPSLILYRDRELGRRVAQFILASFAGHS